MLRDGGSQFPFIPDLRDNQKLQHLSLREVRHCILLFPVSYQETGGAGRQKFFPAHRIIPFFFQSSSIICRSRAFTLISQVFLESSPISVLGAPNPMFFCYIEIFREATVLASGGCTFSFPVTRQDTNQHRLLYSPNVWFSQITAVYSIRYQNFNLHISAQRTGFMKPQQRYRTALLVPVVEIWRKESFGLLQNSSHRRITVDQACL